MYTIITLATKIGEAVTTNRKQCLHNNCTTTNIYPSPHKVTLVDIKRLFTTVDFKAVIFQCCAQI